MGRYAGERNQKGRETGEKMCLFVSNREKEMGEEGRERHLIMGGVDCQKQNRRRQRSRYCSIQRHR